MNVHDLTMSSFEIVHGIKKGLNFKLFSGKVSIDFKNIS
jgi:hypothetical protein